MIQTSIRKGNAPKAGNDRGIVCVVGAVELSIVHISIVK
jgi:hypothetical protein